MMTRKLTAWDRKLLELDASTDEAAALFALKWQRLAAFVHDLDNERLDDLWDETSDALLAFMQADDAKKEHGLKMLLKWAKIGERVSRLKAKKKSRGA